MKLYDETIEEEGGQNADNVDIVKALSKLEESISRLDKTITDSMTEAETEEVTEEATSEEVVLEEDQPLQKKDMAELKKSVDNLCGSVDKIVSMEQEKAKQEELKKSEATRETPDLIYLDETVDSHLYLTSQVENADINDVYTMTLSIRNVCVLALLLALSFCIFKLLRTCLERMLNR